ncbi:MAG: hypothetical protein EKK57_00580 [Proteobacteria bacterium]|nr:MAG: hypothetical protein EKK57_00580 [Pseudomonadota bacterium]
MRNMNLMASKIELKMKIRPIYLWDIKLLLLVAILFTMMISFLIYNNYTVDYHLQLDNLKIEENTLKQEVKEKYGLTKSVSEYTNRISQLTQIESIVNSRFPDRDEIPSVLIQVNEMAEQSNVAISSLIPNNNDRVFTESSLQLPSDIRIVAKDFNISATSNFNDFVNFVYGIASYPRVMQIRDVRINRIDDNKVSMDMVLTIFYTK